MDVPRSNHNAISRLYSTEFPLELNLGLHYKDKIFIKDNSQTFFACFDIILGYIRKREIYEYISDDLLSCIHLATYFGCNHQYNTSEIINMMGILSHYDIKSIDLFSGNIPAILESYINYLKYVVTNICDFEDKFELTEFEEMFVIHKGLKIELYNEFIRLNINRIYLIKNDHMIRIVGHYTEKLFGRIIRSGNCKNIIKYLDYIKYEQMSHYIT